MLHRKFNGKAREREGRFVLQLSLLNVLSHSNLAKLEQENENGILQFWHRGKEKEERGEGCSLYMGIEEPFYFGFTAGLGLLLRLAMMHR